MFLYIDATAGGMLLQVLLGGFAGVAVIGRLIWGRIFGRGSNHSESVERASVDATGEDEAEAEQQRRRAA